MKKNIAIVGMGRISINHLMAIENNCDKFNLVAVCDLLLDNIDHYLEKSKTSMKPNKYINYKEMLKFEKIEVLTISTDSGSHAEIALHALNLGINVIIEKPMALSVKDTKLINEIANKKKLLVGVCHQNRFNKAVNIIYESIKDNKFGKISHIAGHLRWSRDRNYYQQAQWRGKWESDGGCLMNQSIHLADIIYWFMGEITEVFAYTNNAFHSYIEAEDIGLALFKGSNGIYATFEGTVNVYPKNLEESIYVFGENGTAKASGKSMNELEIFDFRENDISKSNQIKELNSEEPPNIYGYGHSRLYDDYFASLINGKKPLVDGVEGQKVVELILAIYKSKKTGLPVKLPLNNFDIIEMRGQFDGIY
jgi:predicted dehydrogenase